jgi:hypothetical protein
MLSGPEFYQQRAAECSFLAEGFSDPHEREIMRQLAICWLHLVEKANEKRQRELSQDRSAA